MLIVALIVATDSVHIRVYPLSASETVSFERDTLPFCKGVHDFRFEIALFFYIESHRAFNAVEVVVHARIALHEKRCGHSLKPEIFDQIVLKGIFYKLDCLFGFADSHF